MAGIGDAQCGGFFPAELKFAGFDGIVLRGRAHRQVYLWVHEGEYELRAAAHLWGKITGDSESMIRDELGDERVEIAQIGPAGENLVRLAAIMNMSNRANGRCGLGAVMGSKNLKAWPCAARTNGCPLPIRTAYMHWQRAAPARCSRSRT
jgi:aldehyde:ferredoxin oxidoreductase